MNIRRDSVAVSSVLFTIALLMLAPLMWGNAVTLLQRGLWPSDPEWYRMHDYYAPMGFASLSLILTGLIVTWLGYLKGVRWTWFVMFLIVWAWDFPLLILPGRHAWRDIDIIAALANAIRGPGLARVFVEVSLAFLLMVLALVLPLKTFIPGRRGVNGEFGRANSGVPDKPTLWEKWQGTRDSKIRRDAVAVSSILFTLALLMLTPAMWRAAANVRDSIIWGVVRPLPWVQNSFALSGIASLAVIEIGLIVTWFGYLKGVRWTWFVMFVIVWVWAFPVLLLPHLLPWRGVETMAQSFAGAVSESGTKRSYEMVVLAFLLMVLALALPVKTLIMRRATGRG